MTKNSNMISGNKQQTLYPVIMAVPDKVKDQAPRERIKFLSRHARQALAMSADKCRMPLGELTQDEHNAPLPCDGTYWSITHKTEYVGGVVAPSPIGIDIEKICQRTESLFKKVAGETEWSLADKTFVSFFRFWTAKEAVLKATGIGLKALSKCRVIDVPDARNLDIEYDANIYRIQHHFFDGHIASVVKNEFRIEWTVA
jgi:4'-phosphopantetheinyl transferase